MSLRPSTAASTPLPPLDITLLDATGQLGWIAGNRLGFTGFADEAEASAAAWIAHVALERRRAKRDRAPAPRTERPPVYLATSGEEEWIEIPGRRLALLLRPEEPKSPTVSDAATNSRTDWFGMEIVFPEDTSALTMGSSANVIYRGLRRSGLQWSIRAQDATTPITAFRLDRDMVDAAAFDSFPASDPPAWAGFRVGPPSLGVPHLAAARQKQGERRILVASDAMPDAQQPFN